MARGDKVIITAALAGGATVVAPGTSCRHQIRDGTGRAAVHPVEVLAARLAAPAPAGK